MPSRDNFPKTTREHLARSVNYHCSKCGAPTAGPYSGGGKSITTGVAAHISAAARGGPRYDATMTPAQRGHYDNGIWLCAAHAPLVDYDWPHYTIEKLRQMKGLAESEAAADLEYGRKLADLRPLLDGPIRWSAPRPNEKRPGYAGLFHAVFTIAGLRKERGRAYIEVDGGTGAQANPACISKNNRSMEHEWPDLRPTEPYLIPVFARIDTPTTFWLDDQFPKSGPIGTQLPLPILSPGIYVTDQPFLTGQDRQPLATGSYRLRVKLVLGDSKHLQAFFGDWMNVPVA